MEGGAEGIYGCATKDILVPESSIFLIKLRVLICSQPPLNSDPCILDVNLKHT